MKRELLAALLLLLLIAGAALDLRTLDKTAAQLTERIRLSQTFAESGDTDAAAEKLADALGIWLRAGGYTHIFLRQSETDAVSDAFFDLQEALLSGETDTLPALYGKLLYHLNSACGAEHLTPGSIF